VFSFHSNQFFSEVIVAGDLICCSQIHLQRRIDGKNSLIQYARWFHFNIENRAKRRKEEEKEEDYEEEKENDEEDNEEAFTLTLKFRPRLVEAFKRNELNHQHLKAFFQDEECAELLAYRMIEQLEEHINTN